MPNEPKGSQPADDDAIERVLIWTVLTPSHDERWTFPELERQLYDFNPDTIRAGAERLQRHGVIHIHENLIIGSRCAWCLEKHHLISI